MLGLPEIDIVQLRSPWTQCMKFYYGIFVYLQSIRPSELKQRIWLHMHPYHLLSNPHAHSCCPLPSMGNFHLHSPSIITHPFQSDWII